MNDLKEPALEASPSTGWRRVAELMAAEDGAGERAAEYVREHRNDLVPEERYPISPILDRLLNRIETEGT